MWVRIGTEWNDFQQETSEVLICYWENKPVKRIKQLATSACSDQWRQQQILDQPRGHPPCVFTLMFTGVEISHKTMGWIEEENRKKEDSVGGWRLFVVMGAVSVSWAQHQEAWALGIPALLLFITLVREQHCSFPINDTWPLTVLFWFVFRLCVKREPELTSALMTYLWFGPIRKLDGTSAISVTHVTRSSSSLNVRFDTPDG